MRYTELIEKHQKEFNKFPLGFAFSWEQFKEMMEKWGLDPKNDLDKISRLSNDCGGFIRKKDIPAYKELTERLSKEMKEAMQDDVFFVEAAEYELANHEFIYNTYQGHYDTLTSLGFQLKKPENPDDIHNENYFNNPSNFNLTERELDLYQTALYNYHKKLPEDY